MNLMQALMMACSGGGVTNYTLKKVSYIQNFDFSSSLSGIINGWFTPNGTKIFCCGGDGTYSYTVKRYTLSTAWDISTITGQDSGETLSSNDQYFTQCFFNSDGTIFYIYDDFHGVYRKYSTSVAYSINSDIIEFLGTQSFSGIYGYNIVFLNRNLSSIYGTPSDLSEYIKRYTLSTAGDFTTASLQSSLSGDFSSPILNESLTKLIIYDDTLGLKYLKEYNLTNGDLSTAVYTGRSYSIPVAYRPLSFNNDGSKMYLKYGATIREYSLI